MGSEGTVIVVGGLLLGWASAYLFTKTKYGKNFGNPISKMLNNPEKLVQELNKNEFLDNGKRIEYYVKEENGKKTVGVNLSEPTEEQKKVIPVKEEVIEDEVEIKPPIEEDLEDGKESC